MTEQPNPLTAVPAKWANPPAHLISKLPRYTGSKETPKPQRDKRKCTECGTYHEFPAIHLDFMGHADVTLALIDVDPQWTWEPAGVNENGAPVIVKEQTRLVLWGYLTVHNVRRLAVGTCEPGKSDPEKELIGDLLRNGAMRFGIGTGLWSKSTEPEPETKAKPETKFKPEPVETPKEPKAVLGSAKNPTDIYLDATELKARANALTPKAKALLLEGWPLKLVKPIPDRIAPSVHRELTQLLDRIEDEATSE